MLYLYFFYPLGKEDNPKFTVTKMCFKYKCSNLTEWGTRAPPSETTCTTDENGLQRCEQNQFTAEAGIVSIESKDIGTKH